MIRDMMQCSEHTPLTRSSIPIHSDKHRMSIASARACSLGVFSASSLCGRTVFTVAGVSGTVVSPSSATLVSFYRKEKCKGGQEALSLALLIHEMAKLLTARSSSSMLSRSSCTTSTTTRISSLSFMDSLRRTSRQRATRPSGRIFCDIMSPESRESVARTSPKRRHHLRTSWNIFRRPISSA